MWAGDETPSDEMFVDGEDSYLNSNREPDGSSNTMMQDLLHNNKLVHNDFFNDFPQDLFDDDDLAWWWCGRSICISGAQTVSSSITMRIETSLALISYLEMNESRIMTLRVHIFFHCHPIFDPVLC